MIDVYESLTIGKAKLSVVGLGYVGLPLAVAFGKEATVIGYDSNEKKIELYKSGIDPTDEAGSDAVKHSGIEFTDNPLRLKEARFHIIAVPTPVRDDNTPDLSPLEAASRTLGQNLERGSVVVYESTVYPGVTEDVCVPILEQESGLKCGKDFKVGYSPERINPGDKEHRLENIVKVVSGMDAETLDMVANVYGMIALAGVPRAPSIKVAEAAKVIENSQRDINIAFMNELSIIFHRMGIDTHDVLEAAGTKWNFLRFTPGLVGGHCIGVDPYYLTYKAEMLGYHSQIILSGRRINDGMGVYVATSLVKRLIMQGIPVKGARVGILGLTFKENCPDVRNTKVMDIYHELMEYGICPIVADPIADMGEAERLYGLRLKIVDDIHDMDAVVIAVAHQEFISYGRERISSLYRTKRSKILFDLKAIYDKKEYSTPEYDYWRM